MGLPKQSCEQSLFRKHSFSHHPAAQERTRHRYRVDAGILAGIVAMAMLAPLYAGASEQSTVAKAKSSMRKMTEEDLARVSAQGLSERFLDRMNKYFTQGFAVEVLGDMATLLNPVAALLDANAPFRDAIYNPLFPTSLIDASGTSYFRRPDAESFISSRTVRLQGSGSAYGSVYIRSINTSGTTIKVTRR